MPGNADYEAADTWPVSVAFRDALAEHVAAANADAPLALMGFVFPPHFGFEGECLERLRNGGNLSDVVLQGFVWLDGLRIEGPLSLVTARFRGGVSVRDLEFAGELDLAGCIFEKDVSFVSCSFEAAALITNGSFEGEVSFSRCRFGQRATFGGTSFAEALEIEETEFRAPAEGVDLILISTPRGRPCEADAR